MQLAGFLHKFVFTILVVLVFGLTANSTLAASCKGKTKSSCSSTSSCTWVDSYKRKDGKKVNAYCRAKPTGKSKSSDKSSKKLSAGDAKKESSKSSKKPKKADKKKSKKDKKEKASKKTSKPKKTSKQ